MGGCTIGRFVFPKCWFCDLLKVPLGDLDTPASFAGFLKSLPPLPSVGGRGFHEYRNIKV
jgi:hypothetical protein